MYLPRPEVEETLQNNTARLTVRLASVCLLALAAYAPSAAADDWRYTGVNRIVAISDVHGDYDAMVATLKNAGVLDDALDWAGGTAHLVITGDLLDRGPESRKVMDVLMRIEPQAAAAGGRVHPLLGNHEVMNLVGDLRYVAREEYAAFAEDERPEDRERWFQKHLAEQLMVTDEAALRQTFNDRHPPGFFGHRRAFRSDGKYGRWLLEKPLLVVIDGIAFVHGGLSPKVAELGLDGVNGRMKAELADYVAQLEILNDAGLLDPAENFYRHAATLEALPADLAQPEPIAAAIETVIRLQDAGIHAPDSPLWYRGNVGCGPLIEHDRIGPALDAVGASRVVIGHTPTLTRQVLSRLEGRVIEIDTGMLNAYYDGSGNALIIEGDAMSVVNEHGGDARQVSAHPRRVGRREESISAADIESILLHGNMQAVAAAEGAPATFKVTRGGETVDAVFLPNPRRKGLAPDLAAYRLDRHLELGMVPVTVSRELNGKSGVLQFLPGATINEAQRIESRQGSSAWCPLPDQWNAMYVFDVLVHNPGRNLQHMAYSQDNWQLILTGHGASFDTKRSRPDYLKSVPLDIGLRWQERLEALNDEVIEEQFGDVLDKRRRRALQSRRDALLEEAAAGT